MLKKFLLVLIPFYLLGCGDIVGYWVNRETNNSMNEIDKQIKIIDSMVATTNRKDCLLIIDNDTIVIDTSKFNHKQNDTLPKYGYDFRK